MHPSYFFSSRFFSSLVIMVFWTTITKWRLVWFHVDSQIIHDVHRVRWVILINRVTWIIIPKERRGHPPHAHHSFAGEGTSMVESISQKAETDSGLPSPNTFFFITSNVHYFHRITSDTMNLTRTFERTNLEEEKVPCQLGVKDLAGWIICQSNTHKNWTWRKFQDAKPRNLQLLKQQTGEQIRLAAMEKAYAEKITELLTRKELESSKNEFAWARLVRERASEEMEKAQRMREKVTRKINAACQRSLAVGVSCKLSSRATVFSSFNWFNQTKLRISLGLQLIRSELEPNRV